MDDVVGDVNGDGLVNSADTGVEGDTNGDGVVDDADTGLVADADGEFACTASLILKRVISIAIGSAALFCVLFVESERRAKPTPA